MLESDGRVNGLGRKVPDLAYGLSMAGGSVMGQ